MTTVSSAAAPADYVGTSIVLVGPCDPMVLQPETLTQREILSASDVAQLKYEILAAEVAVARLPWVSIVVEQSRLTVSTTTVSPLGEPIRDFLLAFCDALPSKRFTALGINHDTHFGVQSEEIWHRLGHVLAPKETVWRSVMREPGMASLAIKGRRIEEDWPGEVNVQVEPSVRIQPGVYVRVNDHFTTTEEKLKEDADYLLDLIEKAWSGSNERASQIVAGIKAIVDVPS